MKGRVAEWAISAPHPAIEGPVASRQLTFSSALLVFHAETDGIERQGAVAAAVPKAPGAWPGCWKTGAAHVWRRRR